MQDGEKNGLQITDGHPGNHVFSFHYGLLKIKHIFQIKVILRVLGKLNPQLKNLSDFRFKIEMDDHNYGF